MRLFSFLSFLLLIHRFVGVYGSPMVPLPTYARGDLKGGGAVVSSCGKGRRPFLRSSCTSLYFNQRFRGVEQGPGTIFAILQVKRPCRCGDTSFWQYFDFILSFFTCLALLSCLPFMFFFLFMVSYFIDQDSVEFRLLLRGEGCNEAPITHNPLLLFSFLSLSLLRCPLPS